MSTALLQIERASEQLLGHEESRLRLSVFSSFAVRWLVPGLSDLQRQGIALTNDYMLSARKDSEEFVRLPCHSLVAGDKFYFAWKTSRRRERGIQTLCRWLASEAIEGGLRSEAG